LSGRSGLERWGKGDGRRRTAWRVVCRSERALGGAEAEGEERGIRSGSTGGVGVDDLLERLKRSISYAGIAGSHADLIIEVVFAPAWNLLGLDGLAELWNMSTSPAQRLRKVSETDLHD